MLIARRNFSGRLGGPGSSGQNESVPTERMKEMTMLDPDDIDLDLLVEALDDHSAELDHGHSWWLDPVSGAVRRYDADLDEESADDLDEAGFVNVDALPSSVGYEDMEDFIEQLSDRRARDLLQQAIEGRGAFRRFKDRLFEFPDLRQDWFTFRDARARRRAVEWLHERALISDQRASEAINTYADPPVGGRSASLSRAVAADLQELYGSRLVTVLVFGSRARGDADSESDLDLLVVLEGEVDPWAEHRRMEEILWKHTLGSGTLVSALPVAHARFEAPDEPVLIRARSEAVPA
jgi:predicted nucleotidyltransferase